MSRAYTDAVVIGTYFGLRHSHTPVQHNRNRYVLNVGLDDRSYSTLHCTRAVTSNIGDRSHASVSEQDLDDAEEDPESSIINTDT